MITEESHLNLGHTVDVISLLAALDVVGATVFSEGTASADEVRSALGARTVDRLRALARATT